MVPSAAVSYTLAEQFSDVMELRGLQSAARMGRARGNKCLKNTLGENDMF